jgi:hypothetical protein
MHRNRQQPLANHGAQDGTPSLGSPGQQTLAQALPVTAQQTIGVRSRGSPAVQRALTELSPRQLTQLRDDTPEQLADAGFVLDGVDLVAVRAEAATIVQNLPQPAAHGFNMANRTDANTGMNFLLAAAQPDLQAMSGIGSGYTGPVDEHASYFNPEHRNPANRSDLGRVMAQHAGLPGRLPATAAAEHISPGLVAQEYLHRQGHGIGGMDVAANLGSGSARANTEMIPVEAAVAGRGDLVMAVTFEQQTGTVLIHRIRMQIYNQETGQLVFAHEVDGQSLVYTRAQYNELGARARAALSPDVIEVYAEYPRLTRDEAQAIVALLDLSRG